MKKKLFRKVIVAVLVFVVAFTSAIPNNAYAMTLGRGRGGFRINFYKTLPDDNGATAKKLLSGDDDTEYALGAAAYFALFASELNIIPNADCEGRAAADELYVTPLETNEYKEMGVKGLTTFGVADDAVATIICNNSISKRFGKNIPVNYSKDHIFVTSTDVTTFEGVYGDSAKKIDAATYKVSPNSIIDFPTEMTYLQETSMLFTSLEAAETDISESHGNVNCTFTGTDTKLNVFNITAEQWTKMVSSNNIDVKVPEDSYVIFNIGGESIVFSGGVKNNLRLNGQSIQQSADENCLVLFNFFEATTVEIDNGTVGNVLAPLAEISNIHPYGHNNGQLIALKIEISNEQGAFGFTMPKSFLPVSAYTVHYVYYDADGELHEIPAALYDEFIGRSSAPNAATDDISSAYKPNDTIQAIDGAAAINSACAVFRLTDGMSIYDTLYDLDFPIQFAVYEDGKSWNDAKTGNDLLNPETYSAMTRKSDIGWTSTYTFARSNVYFVMYPMGKVTIDVSWDDKLNKSNRRPDDFYVALVENVPDAGASTKTAKEKNKQELLENTSTNFSTFDAEVNKDIIFEKYSDTFEYYVPLFGKQPNSNGKDSEYSYGTTADKFGENGLFNIAFEVPEDYADVTVTRVDKNGTTAVDDNGVVAQFHIVLRGEYKAVFYIVDPDTNQRTEVYKDNFYTSGDYAKFRGYATTDVMPSLTNDEITKALANKNIDPVYTVTWKDIKTGRNYEASADEYEFDYEDVIFETTVRRAELMSNSPWLYVHIIRYMDSYYVPGKMLWKRLDMDGTTDPTKNGFGFIQKTDGQTTTDYSYESLKKGDYDDDEFFMFSFVYGIDTDRAVATRATVSTEGFGSDAEIFYEAEKMGVNDGGMTDTFLGMKGGSSLDIHKILEEDNYCQDYDGMRYFRLALPADEFVDKNLYFTVYYIDEDGQESVWFYYFFDMDNNKYWTIEAK